MIKKISADLFPVTQLINKTRLEAYIQLIVKMDMTKMVKKKPKYDKTWINKLIKSIYYLVELVREVKLDFDWGQCRSIPLESTITTGVSTFKPLGGSMQLIIVTKLHCHQKGNHVLWPLFLCVSVINACVRINWKVCYRLLLFFG